MVKIGVTLFVVGMLVAALGAWALGGVVLVGGLVVLAVSEFA